MRMNFLPPDSELTDPHGEINDMRVRWDIRFSETARGRPGATSSWSASVWGLLAAALALALGAAGLEHDGAIVILASGALALGAILCARHRSVGAALGCLIASGVILAIAGADYRQESGEEVGWALQVVLLASIAATVLSVSALLEARRRPR